MEVIYRLVEIGPVFPQFKDRLFDYIQREPHPGQRSLTTLMANVNKAAGQNCLAAFLFIQNPNSMQ